MSPFAMIAALIAISLAQSQPPPKAPPPSLPPELSDLLEDPSSINDFDYMALKHAGADLKAASDAVYASAFRDDRSRCLTPAEAALQQHLAAAEIAASTAEFKADKDAADRAWSLWTEFAASVMRGDQANPPFDAVSTRIREVQLEDHPRAKDLLTRTAKDQLYRHGFTGADQVWGALSPGARSRAMSRLSLATCDLDRKNTIWLKADVSTHGWFLISTTGARLKRRLAHGPAC